jgi:uncharacterized protein YhbP (UPF0306 family)
MKDEVLKFLESRRAVTIATINSEGNPWVANVYFANDENFNLYFISDQNTNHSQHIKDNPNVACSMLWYSEEDMWNRKGIQSTGLAEELTLKSEIEEALKFYNKKLKSDRTYAGLSGESKFRIYKIKLTNVKFWNDELFGEERSKIIDI